MHILWPIRELSREDNQFPGVMGICSLLKQEGFSVELANAEYRTIASRLDPQTPTILAYSTPTCHFRFLMDLNRRLKKEFPAVFSVFGGSHPTFFPEMIEEEGVDGVCIGEGEYAMLELAREAAAGRPLTGIRNWWIKADARIHRNPLRPLVQNLDELPLPDHELFRQAMKGKITQAIVLTGRGCPFRCSYCFNHVYRDLYPTEGHRLLRRRSVDHVMGELREIKRHGYQFIRFMDDVFILSREWVREFADKYQAEIGLPFTCLVRANYVTREIIADLKRAGCHRVMMGIECGNERVRNEILKRSMSDETIVRAAETIKAEGLKLVTANILAIPGGSLEADLDTLRLNIRCQPDYASVALLAPFPRTQIHEFARAQGYLDQETDAGLSASFGFGLRSFLNFPDPAAKRQMENLQKFFYVTTRHPWLLPLVRRLIRLPSNRIFDLIYVAAANYGMHLRAVPPRAGIKMFWRRILNKRPSRLAARPAG